MPYMSYCIVEHYTCFSYDMLCSWAKKEAIYMYGYDIVLFINVL